MFLLKDQTSTNRLDRHGADFVSAFSPALVFLVQDQTSSNRLDRYVADFVVAPSLINIRFPVTGSNVN